MGLALGMVAALGAGAALVAARPLACFEALLRILLPLAGVRSRRGRVSEIDLHWFERPGAGPAIVLLHGLGTDAGRLFTILPTLARGRRMLAPSLPAHGRSGSPPGPFGVGDLARWMEEWLERVSPGEAVDLVGFSMGGWVAAHLALRRPRAVRRLVLVSSAGVRVDPPPARSLLAPQCVEDVRRLVAILTARPLWVPRFVLRDLLRRSRPERGWLVDSILRGDGLLEGRLASLRAPTLVIWGSKDGLLPVEAGRRLAAAIPDARWAEMAGCGHIPYWERRAEFQARVEEFLR